MDIFQFASEGANGLTVCCQVHHHLAANIPSRANDEDTSHAAILRATSMSASSPMRSVVVKLDHYHALTDTVLVTISRLVVSDHS
jgi:hypothetical protein